MKSNKGFIRFFVLLGVLAVGFVLTFVWWKNAMAPTDATDPEPINFVVPRGQGSKEISTRLADSGLIRSQLGFYLYVRIFGTRGDIQAGEFRLNRTMDVPTIAEALTHGTQDVWITIPEGWRIEEIATLLTKELSIPEKEFLAVAQEGYMFPDTYSIPKDATAAAIAVMFRDNFDKKVTQDMIAAAKRQGLTEKEFITLASLVEREGMSQADRPVIAGILMNRLKNDWPLQVDATLQYVLGYQSKAKTWWKKELTDDDKRVASSYNTYLHTGLPPAPIANPGLASVQAVLHPQMSDYMYYLHDASGVAHYAKTIEEHTANIRKYLQ